MKRFLLAFAISIIFVSMISAQTFSTTQDETKKVVKEFDKNNFSLMMSDVILKRISFEYEHILGNEGNISINIPMSYAMDDTDDPMINDVIDWWVGMGMKLYPTGQGTIRYFIGPEVRIYGAHGSHQVYYENYSEEIHQDYIHSAFLLNNGMIYEPTEHFVFSVNLGTGFLSRDSKDSGIQVLFTPSVRMGIRF